MRHTLEILKRILIEAEEEKNKEEKPKKGSFEDDPMGFILKKYHTLNELMEDLMTNSFKEYVDGIFLVAPKPTTFKIMLHNGQYFFLTYMGSPKKGENGSYEATIGGKKYYLKNIGERERCMLAISRLLRFGSPLKTKGPEGAEQGTREENTGMEGDWAEKTGMMAAAGEEGAAAAAETGGEEEGGEQLTESAKILKKIIAEVVKSPYVGNKEFIKLLTGKYPDMFAAQSDPYRLANKAKIDGKEFEKIIKKDLSAKNIKVYPPDMGPNKSSKFDMYQFDSRLGPVQITLSGGASANKGNAFEKNLFGDLERFRVEGFTNKNKSQFNNLELTTEIVRELKLKKGEFELKETGALNQKRPIKITPSGPEITQTGTVAQTVADLVILKGKKPYYLSLKFGGTLTFFNAGVTKWFPESEIRSGKIKNSEGVDLLKALGIDNKTFCAVFNAYADGDPGNFKVKQPEEIDLAKLSHLISSGIGSGYYYVQAGQGKNLFFKIDDEYNKEASEVLAQPTVKYGGSDGKGKRVDVTFETNKYEFKINIRAKDRGVYPTHIMCDYRAK